MMNRSRTPDFVPTLSPGRHRNPRKGACFMEMASFLAGERWSDHPSCTHPLLAAMAREINDRLGDRMRQELVPLVPSVVGLVGDDKRIDAWIAREAALTALPVVSMANQRAVAVGILRSEAVLAELDGMPPGYLSPRARSTLDRVPEAEQWAREFISTALSRRDSFASRGAPAVVHLAIAGISRACMDHPEQMLVELLRRTIEGVADIVKPVQPSEPSVSQPSVSQPSIRVNDSATSDGAPAKESRR